MYLRTPKRYQPKRRRRHLNLISRRTITLLLVIGVLAALGWFVWMNQDMVRRDIAPAIVDQIEGGISSAKTKVAPPPTPTATPDIEEARAGCINGFRQGNLDQAVEQCLILGQNNPNDSELHFEIAYMLVINWRLQDALEFSAMTVNANPEAPHGWAIQAMALDWNGDPAAALAPALHAKSLDETFGFTDAVLGEIYHDLAQDELANTYLERAVALLEASRTNVANRMLAYTFRVQGKIFSDLGDYTSAVDYYQRAIELAPSDTYWAVELAMNYRSLQQPDNAVQVLTTAAEQNPQDPSILFEMGRTYMNNGNPERAYEYLRRCLEASPDYVPCLSWLGGLQYLDGDYVTAISNLERAIELGSTDPDDFLQIGHAYIAQGRCDLATSYLQQGYNIALERQLTNKQAQFLTHAQSCNLTLYSTSPATATPAPTIEATPQP